MSAKVRQPLSRRPRTKSLFAKFDQGGGTLNAMEAVVILDHAEGLDLCPPGSHSKQSLREIIKDLDTAIVFGRKALDLCPPGHSHRFTSLNNIVVCLATRYDHLRVAEDLDEAMGLAREAMKLCGGGQPNRSQPLNNLAVCLSSRYGHLGETKDLDEAIVLGREALGHHPPGYFHRPQSLNNLAVDLSTRYGKSGSMTDLNEVITLDREVLGLCSPGQYGLWRSLENLAVNLFTRYKHLEARADLDELISVGREILKWCSHEHSDRSTYLNNVAFDLFTRYKNLGSTTDLDESIVLDREVLALRPLGHPDRFLSLNNLAADLSTRYKLLGTIANLDDLDEAILLDREALELCPPPHPDRLQSLTSLAADLSTRYKQLGTMANLDEAILLGREALELCPPPHPDRLQSLTNLAADLSTRFQHLGMIIDLDAALSLDQEALLHCLPGHPDRATPLNSLARDLCTRYKQAGEMTDLDEAISRHREALLLRLHGHPHRPISLSNLAIGLSTRYAQFGVLTDLDTAIALDREALELRLQPHPDRPQLLKHLVINLSNRYKRLGTVEDINEAIILGQEALGLCPPGHSERSDILGCLASTVHARLRLFNEMGDQEKLFSLYAELAHVPQAISLADLLAAKAWVDAAEDLQHSTTRLAYETSLGLLIRHLASLPLSSQIWQAIKQHALSLAVDAFSAFVRQRDFTIAVELLEQGRGIFWSQLTQFRPLLGMTTSSPVGKTLADEFTQLASSDSLDAAQHDRLRFLHDEMQRLAADNREIPGFRRVPLTSLFADLQLAASEGPVIIVNASRFSCDALVILLDQDPVHIPLSITKDLVRGLATEVLYLAERAKKEDVTIQLGRMLRELWERIISPIVSFLQTILPIGSRIWWCPTAEFSTLPLHAAGPFRQGQHNLPGLYISSYAPTLSALIRARRPDSSNAASGNTRFVAIGAAGKEEWFFPSISKQLASVGQCVEGLATFTRIEGQESCILRVAEELGKNQWVHIACHGLPNPQRPFESAFALNDGRFTIERIIRCNLENPEFAYLSACHTTVGDEGNPDEAIHLASAMQFAGFRSVIGTMWEVDDSEVDKIVSTFYMHMADESGQLDHTRAAYALNKTMKYVKVSLNQQIHYIHLGA